MNEQSLAQRNKKLVTKLLLVVVLMSFFAFALVPLYNLLCQQLGINGKTNNQAVALKLAGEIDRSRNVKIQFVTTKNERLPWAFYPSIKAITVHPGEFKKIDFHAENQSAKTMTVQAIPSVTPGEVARYLHKTECFCFERQTLASGKSLAMPVLFHVDSDLPKDIHTITLSYTLFDAGQFVKKAAD